MQVGQPMRVLSRSILAVSCLLLVLTLGARGISWMSEAPPSSATSPAVLSTTTLLVTGSPPSTPGVVVPGPAVLTTKCRQRADRTVCHTYMAPSSGVIFDRSREHTSTAAPWASVP